MTTKKNVTKEPAKKTKTKASVVNEASSPKKPEVQKPTIKSLKIQLEEAYCDITELQKTVMRYENIIEEDKYIIKELSSEIRQLKTELGGYKNESLYSHLKRSSMQLLYRTISLF